MIHFQCNHCGEKYEVDHKHSGKKTTCNKCQASLRVPVGPSPQNPMPPAIDPVQAEVSPLPAAPTSNVQVKIEHDRSGGIQGFFRAFGITSGVMAAVAALAVGVPMVLCGGCLAWMVGLSGSPDTQPSAVSRHTSKPVYEEPKVVVEAEAPREAQVRIITTLTEVDLSGREGVYLFDGLTATVNDDYVQDVRIMDVGSSLTMSAEVLLENRSGRRWVPRVRFAFVNRYGVVLGSDSISWLVDTLEPKKRHTESMEVLANRFDDIFRYAVLTRQNDFDQPKYLLVEYDW